MSLSKKDFAELRDLDNTVKLINELSKNSIIAKAINEDSIGVLNE